MTGIAYERPRLRPEVVLGPGLRSGPSVVHHVKDPATGYFYRIGPREYFIMRRMDGTNTLADIGREYTDAYDRRLGPDSWQQLFTLLGKRRLLDGASDETALSLMKSDRETGLRLGGSWYRKRWVLLRPDRFCAAVADKASFAFSRGFVWPALVLAIALQVFVWTHAPLLASDAAHRRSWFFTVPLSLALLWLITALHELAHGVTCRHFGGTVTEIGVRWRFPMVDAYCRTDDIVLFHGRTARVATAFAGVFVSMLALVPVAALWWFSADWPFGRSLAAGLLLFGSFGVAVNLLPFLQLDGYAMLGHALGMADLRRECVKYWRVRISRDKFARNKLLGYYSVRDRGVYAFYGVISVVFLAAGYGILMWLWYNSLKNLLGSLPTVSILAAETVLLAGLLAGAARARARKAIRGTVSDG